MNPGIYIVQDEDGVFLAQLAEDGLWSIFGSMLAVGIKPDEILAGPYAVEEIVSAMYVRTRKA